MEGVDREGGETVSRGLTYSNQEAVYLGDGGFL